MAPSKVTDTVQPKDRTDWRRWLENNHDRPSGVWLIFYRKASGKRSFTYEEAVEEALCFGWIDGQANRLDEESYRQRFSHRKKGSTWARSNKDRVARLIEQGRMTPAGMAPIEEAKKDGSWSRYDDVESMVIPTDLARALDESIDGRSRFEGFSDSVKKQLLFQLASAKRPETRKKRIADIVRLASEGKSGAGGQRSVGRS